MLSNRLLQRGALMELRNGFATKKKRWEVTIRTPYRTICENDTSVTRLIFRDLDEMVCLQGRMPGSLHVLPPGVLKIRGDDTSKCRGEYIHLGGWGIMNEDNSCEINFMDIFTKDQMKPANIGKGERNIPDSAAGRYLQKLRSKYIKELAKKI